MQTTLRIADEVYRQAKAEAAREGITLTRFIEEALALRLRQTPTLLSPGALPAFRGGPSFPPGFDLVEAMKEAESSSPIPAGH
ncbi:MAG: CopG family transcriptional regulator [Pseudomonadota bacterium]|nr:CopG family transcriptional regulator [Gammaproteobacteria bacterium]MDQ3583162.1 CopG family transcriptional regulator [Pseudomonadota bacterium]